MNRYITYTARAKLRNLIGKTDLVKSIKLTVKNGGFDILYLYEEPESSDILLCSNPRIFTDHFTLKLLKTASVDFSYSLGEFLITRDTNELPTYA